MYKNLCLEAVGISGRQSELIELAMTYGFKGIDLDVTGLARRVEAQGSDYACRYISSARIKIGGFPLPVRWQGQDSDFKTDLERLPYILEIAESVDARRCYSTVMPASDERPYHENFEFHGGRFSEIGDVLARHDIRLGLGIQAASQHRQEREFPFIQQAEALVTLIKTIGSTHVGLLLDEWNWLVGGGGLEQLRDLTAQQIVIVRIADLPTDADPSSVEDNQRLLPGESETSQTAAILSLLGEKNYDGPVTVYPHPSQFSGMTRDAIVQRVASVFDEQFKAAGLSKAGRLAAAAAEE